MDEMLSSAQHRPLVLVVGGGSGLGLRLSRTLLAHGYDVLVGVRSQEGADAIRIAGGIGMGQRRLSVSQIDVASETSVERFFDLVPGARQLHGVVICAAIAPTPRPFWETSLAEWERVIATNLMGTFLCLRAAAQRMMDARFGRIVTLSGGGATSVRDAWSSYATSKAAVVRLTECVAHELRNYDIKVNAVAPGLMPTRMADAASRAAASSRAFDAPVALIEKLLSEQLSITGRLISAVHDDWPCDEFWATSEPWYTLRRVDEHLLDELQKECDQ
ncbi:SDR family oxidoreductase [Curtobacterium sp. BRD11]|uniref:SDR family NAD(P)-dependent oxidoreductase n=1 Tax=Curtobacterium sp. BRD11 TaxID=2962581 RepID=UPI0028815C2C|nr:SDR family oxidoreductase [Curtobacterium sp. BRD11]MDT0212074.1 SDR family oxidoreductase [Curtobacterium sp. BRD11]